MCFWDDNILGHAPIDRFAPNLVIPAQIVPTMFADVARKASETRVKRHTISGVFTNSYYI
jgi:hypothetical protein